MTTGEDTDEAFGDDMQDIQKAALYFSTKPAWMRNVLLQLIRKADEPKWKQLADILEQGVEDARKRREAKRIERRTQREREARGRERICLMLREQEEEERKKRREAQKARGRGKGLER